MNYEERLNILKEELEKSKNKKFRAEARLEQLHVQKEEIIKEIKNEGYEPENLDEEIKILDEEIRKLLKEAEELIPRD